MKKIIIIVVVLLIVLGGGGAAAYFFLLAPEDEADTTPVVEVKEEAYYEIDTMTINLAERDVNRFIQVDLTLMYHVESKYINDVTDKKYDPVEVLPLKLPKIQDQIISLVRNTEYIEFTKADAKDWLAEEIKMIVNEVVQDELIQEVYITNYFLD
jgi:flagellar FliL protein